MPPEPRSRIPLGGIGPHMLRSGTTRKLAVFEAVCVPRPLPLYCRIAAGRAIVHVVTNVYNLCSSRGARLVKRDPCNILAACRKAAATAQVCQCRPNKA